MTRKITILLIVLLVFLLNIGIINASIVIDHKCEDYRCTEGTDITYLIQIENNIDKEIVVNYIKVKNELDENIALYDEVKYGLLPNERNIFNITEKVPIPPTGGYTLNYYACFGVTIKYPDGSTEVNEVCGIQKNSLTVLPLSKVQCQKDNDCKSNEFCDIKFFKCREIECNGFAFNHQCISYYVVGIVAIALFVLILVIIIKNKKRKKIKKKISKKKS